MSYYLNFASKITRSEAKVVYDRDSIIDGPIQVSSPQVCGIVGELTRNFERVALVEEDRPLEIGSDRAYVCHRQDVKQEMIDALCQSVAHLIGECIGKISDEKEGDRVLDKSADSCFSALSELIALRNYLARCWGSSRKLFKSGYFFIIQG